MKVKVKAKQDHMERLADRRGPIPALAELVWNALDGDAEQVSVEIRLNRLDGVEEIRVIDDGHGIARDKAIRTFGNLGASWKQKEQRSPMGRQLHGRAGEGRFAAFGLGQQVEWRTACQEDGGGVYSYTIVGRRNDLENFDVGDAAPRGRKRPGTEVRVTRIHKKLDALVSDGAASKLTELFALYLRTYPDVQIAYNGQVLDPGSVEDKCVDIDLETIGEHEGRPVTASLTIIEWKREVDRALHLCDDGGFTLAVRHAGIHAPGFNFTAYLKCSHFRDWNEQGLLDLDEMHPAVMTVLNAGRDALRTYFRERAAETARGTVEEWKRQEIYPYEGEARGPVESVERQVFDVAALNINEFLPDFAASDVAAKKFSFRMLKLAIERSPIEAQQFIQEALNLPKEKREELSALLARTKLTAIVTAAKSVGDRLDFLAGLDALVFQFKKHVKERSQLHRIVSENTWLFGEQFHLAVDDESLTEVLRKHLGILDEARMELSPVTTLEGGSGIVDLMFSQKIPQPQAEQREHLVVEMKAPKVKLDGDSLLQIEKYAFAVAKDERFRDVDARWIFWLLSNDMTEHVRQKVTGQVNQPDGMLLQKSTPNITIWVKTWSQVIEAAQSRLTFFREKLEYEASHDQGLEYLRKAHSSYLPPELARPREGADDGEGEGEGEETPRG